MRLFLFDIDGTLMFAHGAGHISLVQAMEATFGTAGRHADYDWRGRTDPQIVCDILRAAGIPQEVIQARLESCFARYVRRLEAVIADGHPVDLLPGIPELVAALDARPDIMIGLLTGNVEAGAKAKLRPTGLWPHFRVGAYGSDNMDRRRLPDIARARAAALTGRPISFDRVVIIGDTPLDVDCARACGATAVAVATGQHSVEDLSVCGPDLLFPNFSDVPGVLAALEETGDRLRASADRSWPVRPNGPESQPNSAAACGDGGDGIG